MNNYIDRMEIGREYERLKVKQYGDINAIISKEEILNLTLMAIDFCPTADVVKSITSEWRTDSRGAIVCRHCQKRVRYDIEGNVVLSNFCPACGARMKNAEKRKANES